MTTARETTTQFDDGIALEHAGDGEYDAHLDPGWGIGAGINGGMLLAVVAHALSRTLGEAGHPDPVAVSGYYLSAATGGPARVVTEVVRRGNTMSTGAATLVQGETERVRALATFGDLSRLPHEVRTTATEPELPPLEQCVSTLDAPPELRQRAPMLERFDLRLDPGTAGWAVGRPSGRGMVRGWFRLADGREPDPLSLLLALDALPPVTFDLGMPGWAPTLELSAHVRARPAPGWLRLVHATRNLAGGLFEEDAEVWDSSGRLVAQSRQLARAPRGGRPD